MCPVHGNPAKEIAEQVAKKIGDVNLLKSELEKLRAQNEKLKKALSDAMGFASHYDFCTIAKNSVCVCGYLNFKQAIKEIEI